MARSMQRKVAKVQLLSSFYTLNVLVRKFQADGYLLINFIIGQYIPQSHPQPSPQEKALTKKTAVNNCGLYICNANNVIRRML
jgi:hypothetical protein